jgi:hypothetical protein
MIVRRIVIGGVFLSLTFLFVYGNGVFFSNAVPESSFLGWASTQGVRVLQMPGELFRRSVVTEHDIWNQSFNAKVRYWIGVGAAGSFLIGCVAGALFHLAFGRLLQDVPEPDPSVKGFSAPAAVSLALALMGGVAFGHILGYAAAILGWVALRDVARHPSRSGRRCAVAGIILGAAVLLIWTVVLQIQPPLHAFD